MKIHFIHPDSGSWNTSFDRVGNWRSSRRRVFKISKKTRRGEFESLSWTISLGISRSGHTLSLTSRTPDSESQRLLENLPNGELLGF